jgi:hypothetical protein
VGKRILRRISFDDGEFLQERLQTVLCGWLLRHGGRLPDTLKYGNETLQLSQEVMPHLFAPPLFLMMFSAAPLFLLKPLLRAIAPVALLLA